MRLWRSLLNRSSLRLQNDFDTPIFFIAKDFIHRGRLVETDPVGDYERGIDITGFDL